jgi:hypothetical protein
MAGIQFFEGDFCLHKDEGRKGICLQIPSSLKPCRCSICTLDPELPGKFPLGTSMAEHNGPVELNSSNHLNGAAKRLDLR